MTLLANAAAIIGETSAVLEDFAAINELEKVAAGNERAASDVRWEQAARVKRLREAGKTHREIADSWFRENGTTYGPTHVVYVEKTHDRFVHLSERERPRWNEAYNSPEVRGKSSTAHVSHNSGDNEWYTPPEYIEAARTAMGAIDLDPASSAVANEKVGAARFYTIDDNGLEQHWQGRVWMNPPYAQPAMSLFAAKLVQHYSAGDVEQACVLVNNATETDWWQSLGRFSSAVCFPKGRVKFWHPDKSTSAPLQGQSILYLGKDVRAFNAAHANLGLVAIWGAA